MTSRDMRSIRNVRDQAAKFPESAAAGSHAEGSLTSGPEVSGSSPGWPLGQAPVNAAHTESRAFLSADGLYRYSLTREIADPQFGCLDEDERDVTVTFVGLNPSTADATQDDPTIRRCIRFAREWGFARMKMVNLYAYRATDPTSLFVAEEAGMYVIGPENDHVISLVFGGSDKIVAAWGALAPEKRVAEFVETFGGWQMWALGLTQGGRPRHPLYMRADVIPFVYEALRAA